MADIQANIGIGVDTSQALAAIRQLQREISAFHTSMAKGGALASANSARLSQNLVNTINATGQFSAGMTRIQSGTESFTTALEKNKLSMSQYFRFAGGASRSFGKMFSKEFSTINQVATERVKDLQTQYISMGRDASGALQAIKVRPLALDMDNLGTRVQMVAQKQQLFNQLLKQGSTNLLNFGKNTQWAGRQLMVGFTVPLTIFGGIAIKEFQKIEEQVVKFRRVYGDMFNTDADTEKALSNVRELAEEFTKYGIAVEKTIGLAAKVAQMGNVGTDLTEQVTQATRLAVLGGLEQEEALDTTISLTNAFGIAAEDLAGKIAFLNAAENQTILAIEDFNTAIPLSGSVVRQLGGDVEDLAVLLTAMREGGINASQAGNALKSSLGRLIAPSRNAKETLSGFGIDVLGIVNNNAGDLMGTINTLAFALEKLDPLSRARSIEALFGKFQFARMSTMFQNIVKEGSQANKVLGLTANSTAELAIIAERELSKVEQSPAFKLQKQMEALKASLAPIGEEFVKAIGPLIEFGTRLLKSFNNLGEGGKQFVVILTALAGVVAPAVLMVVGLVANGIANLVKFVALLGRGFAKLSGSSRILGTGTEYMTQQQIEAAAVAASLGQSHSNLIQVFTAEASAVRNLAAAYRQAIVAQSGFGGGVAGRPGRQSGPVPKKYNKGVTMVPGPKGAGDIIPAMLSPGEAVIPATQAQKYSGFIQSIISDNVPGYRRGVFLGMPKSSKQVKSEREASSLIASKYVKDPKVPVTDYGHQIAPTTGRSFPISGVGGAYVKADGSKVFVKPFVDKQSAVAEMRAGQIARDVHGLLAPKHTLVQMRDPSDRSGKRLFYALESKLDPTFANPTGRFTKGEMVKQLLASLVRADKDLSPGNMYGRVLTDPGPGGVYSRASGFRNMAKPGELPSLAQQAEINLLGVKGGARKFFAQSTSDIARGMTPKEYQQMMLKEINTTLPKLRKTIDSFNLTGPEKLIYEDMLTRLEAGKSVDWTRFHTMHSNVPALPAAPMRLADGILSVPGPKGAGDVVPAMLSPGEAVIPAKQSRKHLSLIKGIVADNVPGYQDSNIESVSFGDRNVPVLNQSGATVKAATRFSAMTETVPGLGAAVGESFKDAAFSAESFKRALDEAGPAVKGIIQLLKTTVEVMPGLEGDTGAIASHGTAPRTLSPDEADALAEQMPPKSSIRQRLVEGAGRGRQAMIDRPDEPDSHYGANLYTEQVFTESAAGNKKLLTGAERASEWREDPLRSGASMNESKFINLKDPAQAEEYTEFSGIVADKLDAMGTQAVLDSDFERIIQESITEMLNRAAQKADAKLVDPDTPTATKGMVKAGKTVRAIKTGTGTNTKARHGTGKGTQVVLDDSGNPVVETGVKESTANYQTKTGPVREKHSASLDAHTKKVAQDRAKAAGIGVDTKRTQQPELLDSSEAYQEGAQDVDISETKKIGQNIVDSTANAMNAAAEASSPAKRFIRIGENIVNSTAMGMEGEAAEQTGKPPLPGNLAAPKAPTPPPMPPPSRGAKLKNAILDSAPSKFLGKKLAQQSGVAVTDSKGKVFYDPNEDMSTWAGQATAKDKEFRASLPGGKGYTPDLPDIAGGSPLPVRVVDGFEMDPKFQKTMERGQIETENLSETIGKNVETTEQNTKTAKEVAKTDKRQKRMAVAGKAMGALGGLTMAAGMATQAPGVIGETAQKLVGPLGALTAALPMLIGLGPIFGTLALVIGAGVWAFMSYNKMINEARERGYRLVNALSASEKALKTFAEFAGTASSQDILERGLENIGRPMQKVAGETSFGEAFMESDGGASLLSSIQESIRFVGSGQAADMLYNQMATAVISGVFSQEQARSIVASIGDEVGDYSFSMDINSRLMQLLGPDGEDLLKNPLKLQAVIAEVTASSAEAAAEAVARAAEPYKPDDPQVIERYVQDEMEKRRSGDFGFLGLGKGGIAQELIKYLSSFGEDEQQQFRFEQLLVNPADIPQDEMQSTIDAFVRQTGYSVAEATVAVTKVSSEASLAIQEDALTAAGEAGKLSRVGLEATARVMTAESIGRSIASLENFYATAQTGIAALIVASDENVANAEAALSQAREGRDESAIQKAQAELDQAKEDRANALAENAEINRTLREAARESLMGPDSEITVPQRRQAFEDQDARITANLEGQQKRDVETLLSLLSGTGEEDYEYNFILRGMLEDGDINAATLINLLTQLDSDGDALLGKVIADVSLEVGEDYAAALSRVLTGIENPEVILDILAVTDNFKGTPEELIDYINSLADDVSLSSIFGSDTEARSEFEDYLASPQAQANRQGYQSGVESLAGDYSLESLQGQFGEERGQTIFTQIEVDREKFDSFDEDTKKDFVTDLLVVVDVDDKTGIWKFLQNTYLGTDLAGEDGVLDKGEEQEKAGADTLYNYYGGKTEAPAPEKENGEETTPPGAGSGPQLDSLLKKLRDVRDASISLKKGWEGMQEVLSSIFAGGTKELNIFDGLEKQLRDLNLGEDLIQQILGMDPDEFEKRKSELFNIDGTATAALTNMNKAFDAVAIGEYVNGQEKFIVKTNNQFTAITTLTAAGLTLAEAYEAVQDEALAAAIAQSATADEIARIVKLTEEITKLKEKDAKQQERIRIAEAVQKTNEEFEKRVQIYQKLSRELENYTAAQIDAILNDSNIGSIFLDPTIDSGALTKALADAERKADLELNIRKLTVEGTRGIFEEGFGQAMDAFGRQEQAIELKFKAETSGDDEILRQADEDIAAIQYKLDDYNAELERISWQEEEINDSYEKRFEALDNIADANERIAKAQESQLDIADALSKGDIAAAARAVASLRSQQAQDASKTQREMLEDAQKTQIEGLRSASGLSREEIEDRSQQLERQIFNIEEINKRPAQERIRLATSIRDAEVAALTVLEKTREEWDGIKSGIDMAEASGWKFKETMQEALNVVEKLMEAYLTEKPKPVVVAPAPAAAAPKQGSEELGQPGKGGWEVSPGVSLIAKAASVGMHWTDYYNKYRGGPGGLDATLVKKAGGGMIIPKRMAMGGLASRSRSGPPLQMAMGGRVKGYPMGGLIPYKSDGGFFKSLGSDTIPAMLTPGEFVIRRPAVRGFGVENLEKINRGTYNDGSVYNYNLAVNVKSDSDPNRIARAVITNIKSIENQRIRGNKL
jgi:TP901 family phage tail tape measure protein